MVKKEKNPSPQGAYLHSMGSQPEESHLRDSVDNRFQHCHPTFSKVLELGGIRVRATMLLGTWMFFGLFVPATQMHLSLGTRKGIKFYSK